MVILSLTETQKNVPILQKFILLIMLKRDINSLTNNVENVKIKIIRTVNVLVFLSPFNDLMTCL